MSELTLQWFSFGKVIIVAGYSLFYGLGGYNKLWKRRFLANGLLASIIIACSIIQASFSWWFLLLYFTYFGATSLGYGADELIEKIWKRFYCGLAYAVASLPLAIVHQKWGLLALHTIICVSTSIIVGATNSDETQARESETMIGAMIAFVPMFMI